MTAPDPAGLPTPPQGFPQPRYPAPPGRGRGWGPVIAGLVVGLVLGGGGVAIAWVLAGGKPTGAEADARAACDIVARSEAPTTLDGLSLEVARRWGAASELAEVAAGQNEVYRPLAEALREVRMRIVSFDITTLPETAGKVRDICDR